MEYIHLSNHIRQQFENKAYIPLIINSKKQNIDIDNIDISIQQKHMLNKV